MSDSDDELLYALRNSKGWPTLGNEAADRIEQLEAERDAAHKRGLEDAAKIAQTYSSSRHLAHDMKCGTFPRRTKVSEYLAAAIRAKIQERDDGTHED